MRQSAVYELIQVSAARPELPDFADLDDLSVEELAAVLAAIDVFQSAARRVQGQAKRRMADQLGEKGWAKLGPWVYRVVPDRSWKVRPEREGDFFHEIDQRKAARRVFNPNDSRITALRELFTDYVDTETGEVGLGVFLDETEGETTLKVLPVDKAPKFIQNAQEGVYPKELTGGH